jgi:integrase
MKRNTVAACRGGFCVRLRIGGGRRGRFVIALDDEAMAQRRAERMATMARQLVASGASAFEIDGVLSHAGAQVGDVAFDSIAQQVARLRAPDASAPVRTSPTFREFGDSWTNGELHRRFPDQIPLKASARYDSACLRLHVYPTIGDKALDQVTLDDCEEVMRRVPESAARSRRHIAGTIARVFRMAVYPCRWLERTPLPAGFLPRPNSRKAMAYLYPSEDARLLGCVRVPYEYRLLWGFLSREGMREGEALALTWDCLDLTHGMIRLDANKTDDPRAWALDPGVARALALHRLRHVPDAMGADRVFLKRSKYGMADTLREHLRRAGVNRSELFVANASRLQVRVHDLRGTFVTIALANGRPERWIMARTGHTTSAMVSRYHRTAMSFSELNLGELTPLDSAIPELAAYVSRVTDSTSVGRDVGQAHSKHAKLLVAPAGLEPASP